jgi:hypothetical protein
MTTSRNRSIALSLACVLALTLGAGPTWAEKPEWAGQGKGGKHAEGQGNKLDGKLPPGVAGRVGRHLFRRALPTTVPPPAPPSGPMSMSQSAVLMTSRLCSMTTMVLPASRSWCSTLSSRSMSAKCRPVVGSSRM